MIKKLLTRAGLVGGTLALIVAGAAAFSAFEAHVVNVTATINNALTVPQEDTGITFGNVFPESVSHMPLTVSLSSSFVNEPSVDDVSYVIRQKPKCQADDPNAAVQFPQVTEQGVTFVCPEGSHEMPLLCPYLSKHLVTGNCNPDLPVGTEGACYGIDAFHGTASSTLWTEDVTEATEVNGHLVKGGDTSDNWDIDLHAPCFKGECAQDNVVPTDYQADPTQEGQTFGCDLWVEVNGISTSTGSGTLTVTKIVSGGTKQVSDFPLFVDGSSITSGVATTTTATTHQVSETSDPDYLGVFSGDCGSTGLVTVPAGGSASCTLTNTYNPRSGTLTIVKNTTGGDSTFNFTVTGASSSSPSITTVSGTGTTGGITVGSGTYSVAETVPSGWALGTANCTDGTSSLSGNTISNITIAPASNVTCTFNDSKQTGTITVYKVVNNNGLGTSTPADFQMEIDGSNVAQGATTTEVTGLHTVSEANAGPYITSFSGDCNSSGQITLATSQAAVCVVTNTFPFFTVTVTKVVHNNFGGTATTSDFNLFVGSAKVTSGVPTNVPVGTYLISESGISGYVGSFSGDCDSNTQLLTGANGNTKQCTITNTDIEPNVTLVANVVNGTATSTSFIMRIDNSAPIPSGSSKQEFSNTAHQIEQDAFTGYSVTGITGTGCPSALNTNFTLTPGQAITCTLNEHTP